MHSSRRPADARKLSRVPALVVFCLVVLVGVALPAQQTSAEPPVQQPTAEQQAPATPFPQDSIKADGVRAGAMSGGFFHATITALAINDPKMLASRIERSGDDYVINFADGKRPQRVTAAEVEAVRSSGYDRSDDPWVAAVYRGYEMRVLWDVIHFSIGHLNFSPGIKLKAAAMIDQSEWLVKAYERAIRAKITPAGELDAEALRAAVRDELKTVKSDEDAKRSAENMLVSMDMFRDVANAVKENGELFGGYKAVGNAALPDHIVEAFAKKPQVVDKATLRTVTAALKKARDSKRAAVVSTPNLPVSKLKTRPAGPLPWYAPLHAYTVVESTPTTVTLRNPIAEGSKATIKVPVSSVAAVSAHVTVPE